ncbi:hypothetical protein CTS44_03853, partial [Comamonas thiooxydans]
PIFPILFSYLDLTDTLSEMVCVVQMKIYKNILKSLIGMPSQDIHAFLHGAELV